MILRRKSTVGLLITAALLLLSVYSCGIKGGEVVVLDLRTEKPIPHAIIKVRCSRNVFLSEGTKLVKTIKVSTGESGRFKFTRLMLLRCAYVSMRAEKPGMGNVSSVDLKYLQPSYKRFPERIYMLPESDLNMQRLRYLHRNTLGVFSTRRYEYYGVYQGFMESKKIASNEREKEFVISGYCGRLRDLNEAITEKEREDLSKLVVVTRIGEFRVDHQSEVVRWCDEMAVK